MALHATPAGLTAEIIDEYLTAVEECLANRKTDGGCLGYPSVLLLFCTIEALGNHLAPGRHPFRALNGAAFGLPLSDDQIGKLVTWYRNLLAHAALIAPGTYVTSETEGDPFEFLPDGEPIKIRVIPLYRLVKSVWANLDRKLLRSESQLAPKHYRAAPLGLNGVTTMPTAWSGSDYIPKPTKL